MRKHYTEAQRAEFVALVARGEANPRTAVWSARTIRVTRALEAQAPSSRRARVRAFKIVLGSGGITAALGTEGVAELAGTEDGAERPAQPRVRIRSLRLA